MTEHAPAPEKLFTFKSGGWVLLIAAIGMLSLTIWAVAPAVLRMVSRPPGDGQTIESYAFDLANLNVDRSLVAPVMLHRDMVPVIDDPQTIAGATIANLNDEERGKVLVSSDRVIGIVVNDQARAYPLRILNVHEIINDELAGVPVAVSYHWPCDSIRVFDRRIAGNTVHFGVSGLVYNGNMLLYDRHVTTEGDPQYGQETLWNQLTAQPVAGPLVDVDLNVIPAALASWADWLHAHPDTTVVLPDPAFHKRYNKASPKTYFISDQFVAPIEPMVEGDVPAKTPVVVISSGDERRVHVIRDIIEAADKSGKWTMRMGDRVVSFVTDEPSHTAWMEPQTQDVRAEYALWFAWHALHPEDVITPVGE